MSSRTMKSAKYLPKSAIRNQRKINENTLKSANVKLRAEQEETPVKEEIPVKEDFFAKIKNECSICGMTVTIKEKNFIIKENDKVFCINCVEEEILEKCFKCKNAIRESCVNYKEMPYHNECFTCKNCDKILSSERFQSRGKIPYCLNCFEKLFANNCQVCNQPILRLAKCMVLKGRCWHSECFNCTKCKISLVGQSFLNNINGIVCSNCIE